MSDNIKKLTAKDVYLQLFNRFSHDDDLLKEILWIDSEIDCKLGCELMKIHGSRI